MTSERRFLVSAFLAAVPLISGCAHKSLYFGTKTAIGAEIAGTTTAPTNFTLGYDRTEAALIPAKTNGETHSVYGGLDYDIGPFFGGSTILTQVFATGNAARAAVGQNTDMTEAGSNQKGRVFFATGTRIALNIDFGQSLGQSVPSFLFGFRRGEATIIPVQDSSKEVNAVYADLSLVNDRDGVVRRTQLKDAAGNTIPSRDAVDKDRLPHAASGLRIVQRFATGQAAIAVAGKPAAQAKLNAAAGLDKIPTALTETPDWQKRLSAIKEPTVQQAIANDMEAHLRPLPPTWANLQNQLTQILSVPAAKADLEAALNRHAP